MMRRVLTAAFAAALLAGFAFGFGAVPARADSPQATITPFRGEQTVYRLVVGSGFMPGAPVRLYVSSPAREPLRELNNDGMTVAADGTIWFQYLPSGFAPGDLPNGVWQFRVCGGMDCFDFDVFIGSQSFTIPSGLPARLCTPFVTPILNTPTFGPPGYATDPRSGYTFNDIVAYCGPYATPWQSWDTFLVPANWYPGYTLPYAWPFQTVYPWNPGVFPWNPALWGALGPYNCVYYMVQC
jgi:hypothetical protein